MRTAPQAAERERLDMARGPNLVITHPGLGIYLGAFPGGHIWSKADPMGRTMAVTFEDVGEARAYVHEQMWPPEFVQALACRPVRADMGYYASLEACVRAGLEGWIDSLTPVVNERMC